MTGTDHGFVTADEEQLHAWAMFRLVRRDIISPDGERFSRTHMCSPGAVAVVALTDSGEVLLVSQYRAALGRRVLEIPAGLRDVEQEAPLDTARRELAEETGCTARDWSLLGSIHSAPGITDSEVIVYLASGVRFGASQPQGPEERHMTVLSMPLTRAIEEVFGGVITDAKSVFGLLAAERRAQRGP